MLKLIAKICFSLSGLLNRLGAKIMDVSLGTTKRAKIKNSAVDALTGMLSFSPKDAAREKIDKVNGRRKTLDQTRGAFWRAEDTGYNTPNYKVEENDMILVDIGEKGDL